MDDAFVLSWRPTNIATIALMGLVVVFGYVLVSQGVRWGLRTFGNGR